VCLCSRPRAQGGVIAWRWDANGPVDDRLDTLRDRTDQLLGELLVVRSWLRQQGLDHTSALAKVETSLRADVQSIQQMLDEAKQGAEQTDARALPVVGLGVLLAGIPDVIARFPAGLWWVLIVASVGIGIWVPTSALRGQRRRRAARS